MKIETFGSNLLNRLNKSPNSSQYYYDNITLNDDDYVAINDSADSIILWEFTSLKNTTIKAIALNNTEFQVFEELINNFNLSYADENSNYEELSNGTLNNDYGLFYVPHTGIWWIVFMNLNNVSTSLLYYLEYNIPHGEPFPWSWIWPIVMVFTPIIVLIIFILRFTLKKRVTIPKEKYKLD